MPPNPAAALLRKVLRCWIFFIIPPPQNDAQKTPHLLSLQKRYEWPYPFDYMNSPPSATPCSVRKKNPPCGAISATWASSPLLKPRQLCPAEPKLVHSLYISELSGLSRSARLGECVLAGAAGFRSCCTAAS